MCISGKNCYFKLEQNYTFVNKESSLKVISHHTHGLEANYWCLPVDYVVKTGTWHINSQECWKYLPTRVKLNYFVNTWQHKKGRCDDAWFYRGWMGKAKTSTLRDHQKLTIRVPHLRHKFHFGRSVWVLFGENEMWLEHTTFTGKE